MLKSITMREFNETYTEDIQLIDVRETMEFDMAHIPTARNLPLSQLTGLVNNLDKDKHYYVMCASGSRSANACMYLDSLGYDVTNIQGSLSQWEGEVE